MSFLVSTASQSYTVATLACSDLMAASKSILGCEFNPVVLGSRLAIQTCVGSMCSVSTPAITSIKTLDALSEPLDYALASQLWFFAFSSILILYFFSLSVASVLAFIRGRG